LSNRCAKLLDCGAARVPGRTLRAALRWTGGLARRALPQRCELCTAASGGTLLCAACSTALPRTTAACPTCALPSHGGVPCGACLSHPPPYDAAFAALVYTFPVDRLLQRMKYGGRLALADWAGGELAAAVAPTLGARRPDERPHAIVALPLAPARQRERGYNQAHAIAVRVAAETRIGLAAPLVRVSCGAPQAALPWEARLRNVDHAFAVRADVRCARLALVDDVMTTGATLAAASRALVAGGAARVECWVVARTLPPSPDRRP